MGLGFSDEIPATEASEAKRSEGICEKFELSVFSSEVDVVMVVIFGDMVGDGVNVGVVEVVVEIEEDPFIVKLIWLLQVGPAPESEYRAILKKYDPEPV